MRSLFEEVRANDDASRLLAGTTSRNELQGGWENERIAALTSDPILAAKILRHGDDENKHGRLFAVFLRRRGLMAADISDHADYCVLLQWRGIGLSHARLREDLPPSDPELKRGLAIVADDEVNHLSYCHEELLRFREQGHGELIERTLKRYAMAEIRATRDVSLAFVEAIAGIRHWPAWKRSLLSLGTHAIYAYERLIGWRLPSARMHWDLPRPLADQVASSSARIQAQHSASLDLAV